MCVCFLFLLGDRGGLGRERVSLELPRRRYDVLEPVLCGRSAGRGGLDGQLRWRPVQGKVLLFRGRVLQYRQYGRENSLAVEWSRRV